MMTPAELAAAIIDRLRADGWTVYDGKPPATPPPVPYAIFYGTSGLPRQQAYEGGARTYAYAFRLMCVARTTTGLRDILHHAQRLLVDWRPDPDPTASPIWEDSPGPELTDGPAGDERISSTSEYRLTTRR